MIDDNIKLTDIAAHAGVSIATVSRVINHRGIVRPETLERVESSMRELGLDIEKIRKRSDHGSKGILILNVPSFENPFYADIIKGADASAKANRYHLHVSQGHIDKEYLGHTAGLVRNSKVVGIITLDYLPEDLLLSLNSIVPVVQCCEYNTAIDLPYVGIDNLSASIKIMEHILSTGRRKIAIFNGPLNFMYARDRRSGYQMSLATRGIIAPARWSVQLSNVNYDVCYTAAAKLFSEPDCPDAVFAVSDVYAAAVINAAKHAGLSVPRDVAVVGFDNIDASVMSNPTITTLSQPKYQIGYTACELLIDRIVNPDGPVNKMLLPTELIIRESSAIDTADIIHRAKGSI